MKKEVVLTGITTTGTPHLGNYVGAIRPAVQASQKDHVESFYFLADYHALVKNKDPKRFRQSTLEVAAAWLALGLDTKKATFYRQTDIPEIMELTWILTCMTAKGMMNRAHAYKAIVAENDQKKSGDPDKGISMGLFCYPVLMAADILMFKANKVPVGKDQIQHLEMTRYIAGRFNHVFGETFVLPEAVIDKETAVLSGSDGRKMSKSYDNTIPLFVPEKKLRKLIMKIKTNSQPPEEPKNPVGCTLFEIYQAFADESEVQAMQKRYAAGIGWGEMKQTLFECLNDQLSEPRQKYNDLIADPGYIETVLKEGAEKARAQSIPFLSEIRKKIGVQAIGK
jgi:tryptophanyl-tRNA synthetase